MKNAPADMVVTSDLSEVLDGIDFGSPDVPTGFGSGFDEMQIATSIDDFESTIFDPGTIVKLGFNIPSVRCWLMDGDVSAEDWQPAANRGGQLNASTNQIPYYLLFPLEGGSVFMILKDGVAPFNTRWWSPEARGFRNLNCGPDPNKYSIIDPTFYRWVLVLLRCKLDREMKKYVFLLNPALTLEKMKSGNYFKFILPGR